MFVVVRMPDGSSHRLEALEGWRVMEVIRDWGLPIKAECGGACACATCHVWVDEKWLPKLTPPPMRSSKCWMARFTSMSARACAARSSCRLSLTGSSSSLRPRALPMRRSARLAVGG